MENEQMESTEQNATKPTAPSPKDDGGIGPIIGIVIIIVLLALGAMYYFTDGINQIQKAQVEGEVSAEEQAAMLRAQNTSTDLTDIEADLNATDLTGLDEAAAGFDSELNTQ